MNKSTDYAGQPIFSQPLFLLDDQQFYKYIKELPDYSIIAFDKAYINYQQFDAFTAGNIYSVTRDNADYLSIEEFALPQAAQHILKDERIQVSYTVDGKQIQQQMRRVAVFSEKYQKAFVYITNHFDLTAVEIAAIYANRWQIKAFLKN